MPRRPKPRCISSLPVNTSFKPAGVPRRQLSTTCLSVVHLEALRLKDVMGLQQTECADLMNLSQSTFQRILTEARTRTATALVTGSAIKIIDDDAVCPHAADDCRDRYRQQQLQCPYRKEEETSMPGQDGTGPDGKGPKTGRGTGPCK